MKRLHIGVWGVVAAILLFAGRGEEMLLRLAGREVGPAGSARRVV